MRLPLRIRAKSYRETTCIASETKSSVHSLAARDSQQRRPIQLSWLHCCVLLHLIHFSCVLSPLILFSSSSFIFRLARAACVCVCVRIDGTDDRVDWTIERPTIMRTNVSHGTTKKERTYINVLSVSFFLLLLCTCGYLAFDGIRTHIRTHWISSHVHIQQYFVSSQTYKSDHQRLFFFFSLNTNTRAHRP